MPGNSMSTQNALLREYEKVVDLFLSEGRTAWELVSIWVVIQVGLGSAVALLHAQNISWGSDAYLILLFSGAISSLLWFLVQCRAKMWRENWLFYGLRLERWLNQTGLTLGIFEFECKVREGKRALELFDDKVRERGQNMWESLGALRIAHVFMLVMLAIWTVLFFACACKRLIV
jgi:hypothetical protein